MERRTNGRVGIDMENQYNYHGFLAERVFSELEEGETLYSISYRSPYSIVFGLHEVTAYFFSLFNRNGKIKAILQNLHTQEKIDFKSIQDATLKAHLSNIVKDYALKELMVA